MQKRRTWLQDDIWALLFHLSTGAWGQGATYDAAPREWKIHLLLRRHAVNQENPAAWEFVFQEEDKGGREVICVRLGHLSVSFCNRLPAGEARTCSHGHPGS